MARHKQLLNLGGGILVFTVRSFKLFSQMTAPSYPDRGTDVQIIEKGDLGLTTYVCVHSL